MRTLVISLLTLPAVKLQDSYQHEQNEGKIFLFQSCNKVGKYFSDTLNDPWSDQEAKSWFLGGNNADRRHFNSDLPSVGDFNSDLPSQNGYGGNSDNIPVVGGNIDYKNYQPSWQTQYKIKQNVNMQNIPQNNPQQTQQFFHELRYNAIYHWLILL